MNHNEEIYRLNLEGTMPEDPRAQEIPQWILDYNKHNYHSSAGKAIRELIQIILEKESRLQKLMNEIAEWSDATFGDGQRTLGILHHLKKEVPELIEVIEKEGTISSALFEFADCFMLLMDAATHHGYNAEDILFATKEKLEINRKRKWGKPDENGVVEHIK